MRVAVAMSGGVDSLRAAALLIERGCDVFGIHMRILPHSSGRGVVSEHELQEREEALRNLTSRLGIPLTVIDARDFFERTIIEPFVESYQSGSTPNPCIHCNPKIKFGALLQEAKLLGAKKLSTGHYARIFPPRRELSRFSLLRAGDLSKDQSYFLYGLSQGQLASAVFPLENERKKSVMQWANAAGFSGLIPKESQEICFISSGKYVNFLQERLRASMQSEGPIVDLEGRKLGEHKGIFAYTVGQRKGLGIASSAPYYVLKIVPSTNTIIVGREKDLYGATLLVEEVNWLSIEPPLKPMRAAVRIRNQHKPAPARVELIDDGLVSVRFDEPQRAITPGQAAVFYDGAMVLGGGIIRERIGDRIH